ncbi:MAG: hypothetical protein ACM3SY_03310 [Candidatus Omnitrophota bacterium]
MKYALEERIGNPELFVGRKKELAFFLKWIDDIKGKKSKSTAILARRKMGKTALTERLYNITFDKNDGVIPFYYEVKEAPMWAGDFCKGFFLTFIYQYMAFKSRKPEYLISAGKSDFNLAIDHAKNEGLDYLIDYIKDAAHAYTHESVDILWDIARNAPRDIAVGQGEFIVQIIDEFQFINDKIYRDKALIHPAKDFAGGYLSTAESKVAPLLVSGSWVGWLMNLLIMLLPARFIYRPLGNMPEDEAIEMIFKYSRFFETPVTEETAFLISQFTEGSPFYISAILRSPYEGKDLTTIDGLIQTMQYETTYEWGEIKSTWMEYVNTAFSRVNEKNAKNVVLYLCKHRDREVTRKELLDTLHLDMTDAELEAKLKALVKADIIKQGTSNFDYRGVPDNFFDKVFRSVYQKEIESFDPAEIKKEFNDSSKEYEKKYLSLLGKHNRQKGYFAEYVILDQLMFHGRRKNALLKSVTRNLPTDFDFSQYSSVWKYSIVSEYSREMKIDILARAKTAGSYSIIGEVKSRDIKKFSLEEAVSFLEKFEIVKAKESLSPVIGFVFSWNGFSREAELFLIEHGIAYSEDEQWLDM